MLEKMRTDYHIIDEELDREEEYLGTYSSYIGSPMYNGQLQFDMWDKKQNLHLMGPYARRNKKIWCQKFTFTGTYALRLLANLRKQRML